MPLHGVKGIPFTMGELFWVLLWLAGLASTPGRNSNTAEEEILTPQSNEESGEKFSVFSLWSLVLVFSALIVPLRCSWLFLSFLCAHRSSAAFLAALFEPLP